MGIPVEYIAIGSEIALSLHPILLKLIQVPLITQLVLRLGTFSVLGGVLAEKSDWSHTWGSWDVIKTSILGGIINLIHIGSSYTSYKHLSAGNSLALFYIHPFINILAGVYFLNEKMNWYIIPYLIIAFIGVLLISRGEKEESQKSDKNITLGITMALISAFTESLIFLLVKTSEHKNSFINILQLYPAALALLLGFSAWNGVSVLNGSFTQIIQIIVFNIFIGFIGYNLRFYSIPRLTTVIFSLLTFIGVASGYYWGLLFAGEKPSWASLLGAGLITGSVASV